MKTDRRFLSTAALVATMLAMGAAETAAHESNLPLPGVAAVDKTARDEAMLDWLMDSFVTPAAAAANVSISVKGAYRYISANGLPDHASGRFPNAGNPNRISAQAYQFRVPVRPRLAGKATVLDRQPFGVAINGVVFDPDTAEYWRNDPGSGWHYEALGGAVKLGLDQNNAHVQPNGAYHYHAAPKGLMAKTDYRAEPTLIGYAADGFPIYAPYGYRNAMDADSPIVELKSGYRVKAGTRPSGPGGRYDGSFVEDYTYGGGDAVLDECNGRIGVTPDYPDGTYYYVVTLDYPFIPRCFKGTPDQSFRRKGPGVGGMREPGRADRPQQVGARAAGGPPEAAIKACSGKNDNASCSIEPPGRSRVAGTCRMVPGGTRACVPAQARF